MANKIQFKRGVKANLPILNIAEPAFTTDTTEFFIGNGTSNIKLAKQTDLDLVYTKISNITTLNIKDFGAIGDGGTHPLSSKYSTLANAQAIYPFVTSLNDELDWASAQLAVNTALSENKNVFIPSGSYIFGTKSLILDRSSNSNRVSVIGSGSDNTKITYSGNSACINIKGNPSGVNDNYISLQEVSGLSLISNLTTGSIGISLYMLALFRLKDINIAGFEKGIYMCAVEHSRFDEIVLRWNKKGIHATSTNFVTETCPNNLTYYSCHIASNSVYGAYFEYPTTVNFIGGSIENNGMDAGTTGNINNWGIKFKDAGYQGGVACNLLGVYIESNAGIADVWLENTAWEATVDNSTIYSINGCTFNRGTNDHYSINNIRCTFAIESQAEKQKLSVINTSFKSFNTYIPSSSRKVIYYDGVPMNTSNFENIGCIYMNDLEKVFTHKISHPHSIVSNSSIQTIPNSTWTKWGINQTIESIDFLSLDTLNNQIVLPERGVYIYNVNIVWTSNSTGLRGIRLKKGDAIFGSLLIPANDTIYTLNGLIYGEANENITIDIFQSSGSTLTTLSSATEYTFLELVKIADR